MEQDTRIGLAMGILLIGIVGALFFRNERSTEPDVPQISDPDSLNARIAERPIGPYLSPKKKQISKARDAVIAHNKGKAWEVPEFLKNDRVTSTPVISSTPPDPIPKKDQVPRPYVRDKKTEPPPAKETVVRTQPPTETAKQTLGEYKVQSGDTLSDIAEKYLGNSARYMEIYEMNRDRLRTPHDLRIGKALRVPRTYR